MVTEDVKKYFEEHPECVSEVESFDFQQHLDDGREHDEPLYRKATVDDVKRISFGGWRGEPGVFAWMYPCGIPTYVWIGEMPRPCDAVVFRMLDDPEEAYNEFKDAMYDHEYAYNPDDWEVLTCFGSCPDGYGPDDWMKAWGYSQEVIDAYERARKDVLRADGWYVG